MRRVRTWDREKRAVILTAEGSQQAAILTAEGEREAQILRAQAERESQKKPDDESADAARLAAGDVVSAT